jgi:hypothetical protein
MITFQKQNLESKVNAILDTAFNNNANIQEIKYLSGANTHDKTYLIFRMSGTQKIGIETLLCDEYGEDFILFKIINGNPEEFNQYEYFSLDAKSSIDDFIQLFQNELNYFLS